MLEVHDITEHRNAVMSLHNLNQELEKKVRDRTKELSEEIELRRNAEEQLRHLATHDTLTGLPNRRLLADRIDTAIRRAHREGSKVSVMFIDLDGFKQINDTQGHDAGDEVLKTVAERLTAQSRETDTVARLGGDEFVVVYTDVTENAKMAPLAERVLAALDQEISLSNDRDVHIGGSIGIAFYPDDGGDSDSIMKAADEIMYAVKRRGKNSYLFAGTPD
jgi:diguanylate cyclase (GGDEF)-like protein